MFLSILSGLIVSVDAFFIGLSLGLQKQCRFVHLVIINIVLLVLCIIGFFLAVELYSVINFETDIVVGISFITLGSWCIIQYFVSKHAKSGKTIVLVGLVMSLEAMLITMGITLIFIPNSTFVIPLAVAFAHFGYSALSFFLARTKYVKRIPIAISHIISGGALIIYGLMAIFIDFGI